MGPPVLVLRRRYAAAARWGVTRRWAWPVNLSQVGLWHDGARRTRLWHHSAARGSAARVGLGDQAELAGPGDGLGAVGRAELAQDVADVLFDRVEADHQLFSDARVRRARC